MKLLFLSSILMFSAGVAAGGTIIGNVHAEGKAGVGSDAANAGSYAQFKYKFAEKVDYTAMHDFVVSVGGSFGTNQLSTNTLEVLTTRIAQKGAMFSPHILPVMMGTKVEWPN